MQLRSEQEIVNSWKTQQPMVSIICSAFNHLNYIQDAVQGFLTQETTFPIEIIIHDDASTDGTDKLIERYASQYPQIIKPVLQTVNQYSRGKIPSLITIERTCGKYVAICEGDDFWTDASKLQGQIDFLESHTEFSMHTHAVDILDDTENTSGYVPYVPNKKSVNNFPDVLHKHFIPTLSIVFRKSHFPEVIPEFLYKVTSRDIAYELMLVNKGPCYYLDKKLGVYRHHDHGLTKRPLNPEKRRAEAYELYMGIDEFTQKKWHAEIVRKLASVDYTTSRLIARDGNSLLGRRLMLAALAKDPFVLFRQVTRKIALKYYQSKIK